MRPCGQTQHGLAHGNWERFADADRLMFRHAVHCTAVGPAPFAVAAAVGRVLT